MKQEKKELTLYLIIVFVIAWIFQIISCQIALNPTAGAVEQTLSQVLLIAVMYVPALSVLIVKKGLRTSKTGIGWRIGFKKNWRKILIAWLLPIAMTLIGAAFYYAIFQDKFDPECGYLITMTGMTPDANGNIAGMPISLLAVIQIASAITYAPFFNILAAVGEEIGWRGYMTPTIQKLLGKKAGVIVSGVIWGLWHAPMIVLIGYEYGTGYFGAPITGILGFCICSTAMSIIMSWLYEKSNSIWFPALLHGSFNAAAGIPLIFGQADMKEYFLGPVPCGMISVIPMVIVAVIVFLKWKQDNPDSKESK